MQRRKRSRAEKHLETGEFHLSYEWILVLCRGVMDGKTRQTIPSHGSLVAIANKLKIEIIPNG
jgi:hypothetical protein